MINTRKNNFKKNELIKHKWLIFSIWTLLMIVLLLNNLDMLNGASQNLAIKEARTHFQKDKVFRYWSAMHGGFYVPIDERTTPSPYLEHIPERDIQSPIGKKLTLMNPAWEISSRPGQTPGARQASWRFGGEECGREGTIGTPRRIPPTTEWPSGVPSRQ